MATTSHHHAPAAHVPVRRRRAPLRIAGAVAAGLVVATAVGASAANLGAVTNPSLGATTAVVGSCDTDGVTVAYTNGYSATNGEYNVSNLKVTGIAAACSGLTMNVTLTGTGNSVVKELTAIPLDATNTGAAPTAPVNSLLTGALAPARLVTGVAIVISAV
jgi:hypothetical protein